MLTVILFIFIFIISEIALDYENIKLQELLSLDDGFITRSELRTAFQRMGRPLNDQEINAIFKHVDTNNDGKINFQGL